MSGTSPTEPIQLASDLSPADAVAEQTRVMDALEKAKTDKSPLSIDIAEGNLSPCAIQMLVATKRSAEIHSVELSLSDAATSALDRLNCN